MNTQFSEPKTSEMAAALERWGVDEGDKTLLITMETEAEASKNVTLSARNIPYLTHIDVHHINIYDILRVLETLSNLVRAHFRSS